MNTCDSEHLQGRVHDIARQSRPCFVTVSEEDRGRRLTCKNLGHNSGHIWKEGGGGEGGRGREEEEEEEEEDGGGGGGGGR